MKIVPYKDVETKDPGEGTNKVTIRWLLTKEMGAKRFAMRLFEMKPGGHSPLHAHTWEHELFILEGEGTGISGSEEKKLKPGDAVFVPPNEKHQFRNKGKKTLRFLCLIPYLEERADYYSHG
jgi:quercetin dioxygenase-like cupin family protein